MNDNKVTPDPLTVFKKHAKMSWPWEWTEDYGALNYGEFKKIWTKHVLPLQKELLELKADNEELKKAYKNLNDFNDISVGDMEKECDALKAELSEAKELLNQVVTTYNFFQSLPKQATKQIESFLSKSKI